MMSLILPIEIVAILDMRKSFLTMSEIQPVMSEIPPMMFVIRPMLFLIMLLLFGILPMMYGIQTGCPISSQVLLAVFWTLYDDVWYPAKSYWLYTRHRMTMSGIQPIVVGWI